jgi:hypothetical protein
MLALSDLRSCAWLSRPCVCSLLSRQLWLVARLLFEDDTESARLVLEELVSWTQPS